MIAAFLYIKNDIRRRGGNFALNVLVLTLLMLIMLNIFTVFEGMHEYELADAPEYDLLFGYLDDADVRTISADADVLSVRLKEINGVRHVYITLRESRPGLQYIDRKRQLHGDNRRVRVGKINVSESARRF